MEPLHFAAVRVELLADAVQLVAGARFLGHGAVQFAPKLWETATVKRNKESDQRPGGKGGDSQCSFLNSARKRKKKRQFVILLILVVDRLHLHLLGQQLVILHLLHEMIIVHDVELVLALPSCLFPAPECLDVRMQLIPMAHA